MNENLQNLISLLLDKSASVCERDDAAMDLHAYNNDLVLEALVQVARDPHEDSTILSSCGESIAYIWFKRNVFDKICYDSLTKTARSGIYDVVSSIRPEWLNLLNN